MKKKLGDVLLLGLRRGRGGRGGGGARRHRPFLVLCRSPARVGWIWWEGVSSSSMAWLGEEKGEEMGVLWGREATGRGGGAGGGGAQVGPMRIRGTASLCRRHAGMGLSRTVRGRGADRPEGRVTLQAGSVQKLLPLFQLPKLIFQASKNSTNFCVDTRNQEQPILLGIGRKVIIDLK